jgi:hypothetical protein
MTTCLRTQWAPLSVILLGSMMPTIGCYRPNIGQGTLRCTDAGVCPDGYTCKSDNRCYNGDGGPPAATCDLPTPDAGICSISVAAGQECVPSCQGCACGRCNVVQGVAVCNQTAGIKDVNDVCNPAKDDCKAGLYCQPECNTVGLGRCYKFCSVGADCPDGSCATSARDTAFNVTPFKICDIAPQACDPIAQTGCPTDFGVLACYYSLFGKSYCDCKGTGKVGDNCTSNNSCAPGQTCLKITSSQPQCELLCPSSGTTCSATESCLSNDGTFGYCS